MLSQPYAKKKQLIPIEGLLLASDFNPANGYGEMSKQILSCLSHLVKISIATPSHYHSVMESMGFADRVIGCYNDPSIRPVSCLSIQPIDPSMKKPAGIKNALYTMWESSDLNPRIAKTMSLYDLILTPNSFNAARFTEQTGKPCEVVYHGCNTKLYVQDLNAYATRLKQSKTFTFGAAAHLGHGRVRKGFERIVDWFVRAFPGKEKVQLLLKANDWTGNNFTVPDPRIKLIEKDLTDQECAEWIRSVDCYIDGSTFEGWGMWTHAAMATGRPVIATNYSARCDYFQFQNHIPIGYTIEPAQDIYVGLGHWAMPKSEDAIEAMRWAAKNKKACLKIAERAYQTTKHLTWEANAKRIVSVLSKHDIIGRKVLL